MKGKEMKKSWILSGMLCVFAVLLIFTAARTVHAAQAVKSGNYTYTAIQQYSPRYQTTIYSQKTGGTKKKLITVPGSAYLKYVYNGNLYYEKDHTDDSTLIDFWALNLKTSKAKKILSDATVSARYNQYVVLRPNTGAVMPLKCTVYNMKTGSSKVLTKNCLGVAISGKKIYYAVTFGNPVTSGYKTRIYSCSLAGTDKKAVSGYFTAEYCYKITSKYVQYHRKGKNYKYTF